jgi:hypothetical protein
LRVAEQANEENIIGKEHLPLDFEQAVSPNNAGLLRAMNDSFSRCHFAIAQPDIADTKVNGLLFGCFEFHQLAKNQ